MGDVNKRYVIEVGANKKSLEQLKADLNAAIKEPFNKIGKDGQIHGLSRSDKAAIKADLSSLFGIADEQAEALRKMVQGIIPTDTKGIAAMKTQLQDTLKFATGIMEQMKLISDSTDWMKQGVSFVDKFVGLQDTLASTRQIVDGIQTSVDSLTKSFKEFQDALAVTNPDAFAKRFGKGAKSGVQADANIKAIAKEMTDAAERASMKIQDVIADLEDEGIKIAVTLPDPDAAEFAAQINTFVKKASDQFQKNPIKLNIELLDPFKNGAGSQLTKHQKKLVEQAKEVAKNSGFSDESLVGLDSPDTSRTIRHIIESFQNIQQAVKAGQQSITDATKQWRQEINKELTLKAKFDNLDIKAEAAKLMHELQEFLNENPPLFIDVDIDNFVESLQGALRETVLKVNVQADNIDGKGAVLNLDGAKLSSKGKVNTVIDGQQTNRPVQSSTQNINAVNNNSEAVSESTRTQTVLSKAIDSLTSSIKRNNDLDEIMKNSETSANRDIVNTIRNQVSSVLSSDLKTTDKNDKIDEIISNTPQVKSIISKISSMTSRGLEITNRKREIDRLIASENDQSVIVALNAELQSLNDEWSRLYNQIQQLETNKTRLTNLFLSDDSFASTNNLADKRESANKQNKKRINNIQSVLDSNQSPVQLVFNEVQKFWKQSYRTIEKTKSELDDLKNSNYSDELKAKLSKLTEDEQKAMIQGLISSKEKRITDWETRQTLMSQKGLGDWSKDTKLEDVLKSFTVESLTDLLGKSSTLSDDLLKNSNLKSLSSIKEIAYYTSVAQDALGFKTQTEGEYVDEKTLQARLMELARIKAFTDKVQGMFPKNNGTPELDGIEAFIQFFEKLNVTKDTIAAIVAQAQDKIGAIQESLIGVSEGSSEYQNKQLDINRLQNVINTPISAIDAAKDYLESFKNFANIIANDSRLAPGEDGKVLSASQMAQVIWDGMDSSVRDSVTKAMLSSSEFAGVKELNQVSIVGVLDKMARVFETGALKDITSDDKSYQQLIALLDRQSKFQRAKTVTDLQYGGSVKGSLYDARTPDKPIYVKVVGSHGEESVYDVHKPQKGAADSDRSFSTNSKGLERFFKHLGITEQVDEIVSAMFNDPALAQTLMDQLFADKNISFSTKPFTRTASRAYGFTDTPLGKNLSDQAKLKREIERLESGDYSPWILKSIEGLSGDERVTKIQEIISKKKAELESLKQLELSEEDINQSLIALMNDVETGKAREKDARRSMRRNSNRAANLTEAGKSDWAYNTRQNAERAAAKTAADMVRSGTRGTSLSLENPLQLIIDRVRTASQYGLMDTKEIEQLLAQYDEAFKVARNMPRIKDAGTPVSMFDEINDAWKKEEELRNQVLDMFYGSDGWYVTQVVTDQMSVIEGELARKEQSITSGASSANSAIESQIADINAKEKKAKQYADAYATKLYDKYLKEPEAEIQAELNRRSAEIEAKAKQTQDAKNNLGTLADRDSGLNKLYSDLYNNMQQDEQYMYLMQLRQRYEVGSETHQELTKEIDAIRDKYTAEYNKARKAWIDAKTAELDAEYDAFVKSVQEGAAGDASKNSVAKFNKDFKGKTTSKRKVSGIQKFIESEKQRMYQEAEAATQQAMAALDMSGTVSQESVNKGIEKARKDAEKERKAVLKAVKKKSDAELMAEESYGKAADTASAEVERLREQNRKNEALLRELMTQFGITDEMLAAERGIFESRQAANQEMQRQLGDTDSRMPGGFGGGYLGTIDTSNLATESTLRGIYELLNGAPPAGGWEENNKFVSGIKEELDLSVHSFSSKLNDFASGVVKVANDIGHLTHENMAIFGDGGRVGKYISGKENEISSSQIKNFLSRHKDKNLQLALHNHPDGIAALTPQDIQSVINMKKLSGIGAAGSIAGSKITGIDISDVNESTSKKLLDKYKANIRNSIFAEIFDDDFNIKEEFANSPSLDKQKLSEKLNGLLQSAIISVGLSVDEIYGQIDVSQLDAASKKVANAVVEAGAKAAVESSKQISKEDIKVQQTKLQEKFKTKDTETGKPKYSVTGASKIDQALYNVDDRLTKESLTDKDLDKLRKSYSQLENAFKEEVISHLDQETVDFLNTLRGQISSVLDANSSQIAAKEQQSKAIAEAKKYLSELKTEEGKRVSGSSRAKTGIEKVYGVLDKGKTTLSKKDLTSLSEGYDKLQKTVNHAVFEKLDENTKTVINNAIQQAKTVLDKHVATTQSGSTAQKQTQEIVTAEAAVTQEKQKQNKLATEAVKKEEKQATATKERANAEKQTTKNKKKVKVETTADSTRGSSSDGGNQGGFLGALNRIAQEETLKSIASTLSKGIKTTSDEKGSGGTKGSKEKEEAKAVTFNEAQAAMESYIKKNYSAGDITNIGKLKSTANGYSVDITAKRVKEIAAVQEELNQLEAASVKDVNKIAAAQAKLNGLKKEQEVITLKISNVEGETSVVAKRALQNFAVGTKAAAKELQLVDDMMARLHSSGGISVDGTGDLTSSNAKISNYLSSLRELIAYQSQIGDQEILDPATEQRLSELSLATQNYRKEVIQLLNAVEQYNTGDIIGKLSGGFGDNDSAIRQAMMDAVAANTEYEASFNKLTPVYKNNQVVAYQLAYTLKTGKREVQEMTASLDPLTNELRVQRGAVKEVSTGWQAFWDGLKAKRTAIMQYLISITSISDVIRYMRQGLQSVREIDAALTELKKVTDETDASYKQFLQDMSKTGAEIGATTKDLTTMASEWARLGYSMQQAGELARSTAILLNVSEFTDATQASEALISTMQAFGYAADQSMYVVDVLNEVGKFIAHR